MTKTNKTLLCTLLALVLTLACALTIMPVAGTKANAAEQTTVSIVFGELGLTNGTQYLVLDSSVGGYTDTVITFTATGKTNTGKYYSSDSTWRMYKGESSKLTVSCKDGYEISAVTSLPKKDFSKDSDTSYSLQQRQTRISNQLR